MGVLSNTRIETLTFVSITCLQRCSGYVSPFVCGYRLTEIAKRGFRHMSKYGNRLEIYMTTWNVGETKPSSSSGFYDVWLRPTSRAGKKMPTPDLVVIGMQECRSKYKSSWQKIIMEHLNKSLLKSEDRRARKDKYVLLSSVTMVQLGLYVFALGERAREITELSTETVPTGLGGVYGNKGAVALGLR
jgi:inositol-1,4,5-trisphosphate 5-phosphatase